MSAILDSAPDRYVEVRADRCQRALVADTISFSSVDGPGNRFVAFLQGCNFDCIGCHNPQTIPRNSISCNTSVATHRPARLGIDELLVQIRRAAPFISGITVSGGEATLQPAFVHALCSAVKANPALHHLTCLVDSNGACPSSTWDALECVIDGAMIDLKCLDPAIHLALTGHSNDQVLASVRHLAAIGRLHEVRLLLVAGYNDEPALIRQTGRWLARIEPSMRVKVIGMRAHGIRPHEPPLQGPTPEALAESAAILRSIAELQVAVV